MLFDVISSIFTNSQVLQHLTWTFYLISTACLLPGRNVTNWWVMRDVIWDRWDHHHDVEAEFHGQYLGEQPTAAGRGAAWCYVLSNVRSYPPGNECISHLGKRKHLDSKSAFWKWYVSFLEGRSFHNFLWLVIEFDVRDIRTRVWKVCFLSCKWMQIQSIQILYDVPSETDWDACSI